MTVKLPEDATHYGYSKRDGIALPAPYHKLIGGVWAYYYEDEWVKYTRGNSLTDVTLVEILWPQESKQHTRLPSQLDVQVGGSHYKDRGIQPVAYNNANQLDFLQGSVVKYVTRHKSKSGAEDIKKAVHFLQLILEFQYDVRSEVKYDEVVNE